MRLIIIFVFGENIMKRFYRVMFNVHFVILFSFFTFTLLSADTLFAWTRTVNFEDGIVEQDGVASAFDVSYHGGSDAPFYIETNQVHTGNYSCRIGYAAGNDGPSLVIDNTNVSSGNLWIRAYLYLPSNWSWGPSWVKYIRTWYSGGHGSVLDFHSSGKPLIMAETPSARYDQNLGNDFTSRGDGIWHCYEYYIGNVGSSNQTHRVWVDGILRLELTGIGHGAGESIVDIRFMDTWNDGVSQSQTCYWDDIVVTTDTPSERDARGNRMIGLLSGGGMSEPTNEPPSASAQANPTSVNPGEQVSFQGTGNDVDGTIVSYRWQFGDGATSSLEDPIHSFSQTGSYEVILTVTDNDGATGTDSVAVAVAEDSNSGDEWVIRDDFEAGNLDTWDDDLRQGQLSIQSAVKHSGNNALVYRHDPSVSPTSDNWGALFFGDHPGVYESLQDEIWLEYWTYFSPGFQWPSFGQKMFIISAFESWSAGYASPNSWSPYYLTLYVGNNGQVTGELNRKVGTNPAWSTLAQNIGSPMPLQGGNWYKIKCHLKLNSLGATDGVFELFIDDNLKTQYNNINYREDYSDYGFNHLVLSTYAYNSTPQVQEQYWDDFKLSGSNISEPMPPQSPQSPQSPQGVTIIVPAQ
jgi:PKD repeat protein